MKLLYFKRNGELYPGIYTTNGIVDIDLFQKKNNKEPFGNRNISIDDLIVLRGIEKQSAADSVYIINEETITVTACCPNPSKIICIGLNYRKHAEESSMPIPGSPIIFSKFSNTLIDYQQDVSLGSEGEQFDYEVELGVVIGKKCKNISREQALNYVLGYCVANDLSCRDLQLKTSQWLIGKTLDNFLPVGKYIVTADEIQDPQQLELYCYHNGALRQHSNTGDMIFPVAEIIEYLSRYMTLEPGDLILTGTPEGVIMGLPDKKWLKPGDIVKTEIQGLGFTENKMTN